MPLTVGDGRRELDASGRADQLDANLIVGRDLMTSDDDNAAWIDVRGIDRDPGEPVVCGRGRGQADRDQTEQDSRKQAAPRGHQPRGAGPIVGPGYRGLGRQGDATLDGQFGAVTVSASWQVMRPAVPPRTFGAIGVFAVM